MERDPQDNDERRNLTPRNVALYAIVGAGWTSESGGAVSSPYGWYAKISNEESELDALTQAFKLEILHAGLADARELIGHWLIVVMEDIVAVAKYDDREERDTEYQEHKLAYEQWAAQEDK